MNKPRIAFISHGGGPLPLLGDEQHRDLVSNLQIIADRVGTPAAILVISAHWEETEITLTNAANPELIYDYYGFPEESYCIQYPAPGSPELADKIATLLQSNHLSSKLDPSRGFDHGLFVPLTIMYPEATIPCVQLSLLKSLDARHHIEIGKSLAPLIKDDVLIVGSGFSFHNLRAFVGVGSEHDQQNNHAFEAWLQNTLSSQQLSEAQREQALSDWAQAPGARFCHPREEHLLPLHVCYGAAGTVALEVFNFTVMGKSASAYLW